MLSYRSSHRGRSHIVDESTVTNPPSGCGTLCGRKVPLGADIQESDHLPDCTVCARELRALQRETRVANAEPVKVAPLPSPTTADLRCPICREPLKLGSKSIAPPTAGNGTVRVALLLLCTNEEGHQEKS